MWHWNLFSSIGLLLDMAGVFLIFIYGLPSKIKETLTQDLLAASDKYEVPEASKIKRQNRIIYLGSYSGLILIFLGFAFQFFGTNFQCIQKNDRPNSQHQSTNPVCNSDSILQVQRDTQNQMINSNPNMK